MKYIAGVIITIMALCCIFFIYLFHLLDWGGMGKIKGYQYPVTKYELEKAVDSVLKNNENVKRDTVDNYITEIDSNNNEHRLEDNYYNDGKQNLIVHIVKDSVTYDYCIGYYADSIYWDTSQTSEIAIKKANGYSEGRNQPNAAIKKKLTDVFETEFINKIDKQLGKGHIDTHN